MYDQLDEWIVKHVKRENKSVNLIISKIKDVIETTDLLDTDF